MVYAKGWGKECSLSVYLEIFGSAEKGSVIWSQRQCKEKQSKSTLDCMYLQ